MKGQHFPTTEAEERELKDFTHGAHGYNNQGCRGPICRQEHTRALKEARDARKAAGVVPKHVTHGASCYTNWGCRCGACKSGHAAESRTNA